VVLFPLLLLTNSWVTTYFSEIQLIAVSQAVQGLNLWLFINAEIRMTALSFAPVFFPIFHFSEGLNVEFKKLFGLSFYIAPWYLINFLFEQLPFLLFLLLLAFAINVLPCDKIDVYSLKGPSLPWWVFAYWICNAHSINPFFVLPVDGGSEVMDLLQVPILIRKSFVDVALDIVQRLLICKTVFFVMTACGYSWKGAFCRYLIPLPLGARQHSSIKLWMDSSNKNSSICVISTLWI